MLGSPAMEWFVRRDDAVELGPLNEEEVRALALAGTAKLVRRATASTWVQISETPFMVRRFSDLSRGEVHELVKGAVAVGAFQAIVASGLLCGLIAIVVLVLTR